MQGTVWAVTGSQGEQEKTGCWTVNLPPNRGVKWGGG